MGRETSKDASVGGGPSSGPWERPVASVVARRRRVEPLRPLRCSPHCPGWTASVTRLHRARRASRAPHHDAGEGCRGGRGVGGRGRGGPRHSGLGKCGGRPCWSRPRPCARALGGTARDGLAGGERAATRPEGPGGQEPACCAAHPRTGSPRFAGQPRAGRSTRGLGAGCLACVVLPTPPYSSGHRGVVIVPLGTLRPWEGG